MDKHELVSLVNEEGFIAFVSTKASSTKINHSTWIDCSFGDYLRSIKGQSINTFIDAMFDHYGGIGNYVWEIFSRDVFCLLEDTQPDTYGRLGKILHR